jgi:hypothetical protein
MLNKISYEIKVPMKFSELMFPSEGIDQFQTLSKNKGFIV